MKVPNSSSAFKITLPFEISSLSNNYVILAELPGQFCVWLASKEAKFLKNRYVWANWDVDELKSRAQEIESSFLFKIKLDGMDL